MFRGFLGSGVQGRDGWLVCHGLRVTTESDIISEARYKERLPFLLHSHTCKSIGLFGNYLAFFLVHILPIFLLSTISSLKHHSQRTEILISLVLLSFIEASCLPYRW